MTSVGAETCFLKLAVRHVRLVVNGLGGARLVQQKRELSELRTSSARQGPVQMLAGGDPTRPPHALLGRSDDAGRCESSTHPLEVG
jgi:hypothetical protein